MREQENSVERAIILSRGKLLTSMVFLTVIMFDARSIVEARYSEDIHPDWLVEPYGQDAVSLALLKDL